MSMLSSQIKELREKADMLDGLEGMDNLVSMLREAAETIESLRDRLHPVPAELDYIEDKSRWFELFGTPERAARTIAGISCDDGGCEGCTLYGAECSYDESAMLDWLRGEGE